MMWIERPAFLVIACTYATPSQFLLLLEHRVVCKGPTRLQDSRVFHVREGARARAYRGCGSGAGNRHPKTQDSLEAAR